MSRRVAAVEAGISALQQLSEKVEVAATGWYTCRPPGIRDDLLDDEADRAELVDHVAADVEAGRPIRSIVSYLGVSWRPYALAAQARDPSERRPMSTPVEPDGVREATDRSRRWTRSSGPPASSVRSHTSTRLRCAPSPAASRSPGRS